MVSIRLICQKFVCEGERDFSRFVSPLVINHNRRSALAVASWLCCSENLILIHSSLTFDRLAWRRASTIFSIYSPHCGDALASISDLLTESALVASIICERLADLVSSNKLAAASSSTHALAASLYCSLISIRM